jgi:hypothetical protein
MPASRQMHIIVPAQPTTLVQVYAMNTKSSNIAVEKKCSTSSVAVYFILKVSYNYENSARFYSEAGRRAHVVV